jgi:hypothetical protein
MSEYGEVKDLVDKIKIFSNLKIEEAVTPDPSVMRELHREASDVLKEIEKDLDGWAFIRSGYNERIDLAIEQKLELGPIDDWRRETDKNISELKKVTEYLSAIHRKELDIIEIHEALHQELAHGYSDG